MNSFDIDKWVKKLQETLTSYNILLAFSNDENALDTHIEKTKMIKSSPGVPEHISQQVTFLQKQFLTPTTKKMIEHAINSYSNQILVILATYIETIHAEFFHILFAENNNFIHRYISQDKENNGQVKIKLIIESNSKDEIIEKLISIAKKNVVNGSLKKIKGRIYEITKYQFDNKLIDSIQSDIFDKRHQIVHEAHNHMITKEDIEHCFDLTKKYLLELGKACKKINAPIHDPLNWIDNPDQKPPGMVGPIMITRGPFPK